MTTIITQADMIRALIIGQAMWVLFWTSVIMGFVSNEGLPIGLYIGLLIVAFADAVGNLCIIVDTIVRFGEPATLRTWLATSSIVIESFGIALIAIYLAFNNRRMIGILERLFVKQPPSKPVVKQYEPNPNA